MNRYLRLGFSLALLALMTGCLEFETQTVSYRHDPATDTLYIFQDYQGIFGADDPARLSEAERGQMTSVLTTERTFFFGNWITEYDRGRLEEARATPPGELDGDPAYEAAIRALAGSALANVKVENIGFYFGRDMRLCGAQRVTVRNISKVLADLNQVLRFLAREVAGQGDKTGEERRLLLDFAGSTRNALRLEGNRVEVRWPVTEAGYREFRDQARVGAAFQKAGGEVRHEEGMIILSFGRPEATSASLTLPFSDKPYVSNAVTEARNHSIMESFDAARAARDFLENPNSARDRAALPDAVPWKIQDLMEPPAAWQWLDRDQPRPVRPLTYAGEPYQGQPTRVFAWYASPATLGTAGDGEKSFPGIVLVHGGGGTAFAEWAKLWAGRGYAAMAMDLAGCGEGRQRLPDGGPGQSDAEKFRAIDGPIQDQWTYHAVANVIRAHSWLLHRDEVQGQKTALTGISWGGYLTCIVAGLDPRFEVAMPVYGCGYLRDNSAWVEPQFNQMTPAQVERWHRLWDPSRYLGAARMPVIFLNGTEDFAYPMDSYAKTCALVRGEKNYSIQLHMRHGHIFDFPEFFAFVDQYLLGATPLPVVSRPRLEQGQVRASVQSPTPLTAARLHYTTGPHRDNPKRSWTTIPLVINGSTLTGAAPPSEATVWYVDVTDERKLLVSSEVIIP